MRHLTNSLVDGTLTEAVEALAKIAADRRARPQTFQEKRAEGASDYLTALGDRLNSAGTSVMGAGMPISHGLLGGGIGAGLGGLSALLGNSGKEEKDKRSVLGSVLTGGLAGGGLGAGIGMGRQYLKDTAAPPSAGSAALQDLHQRARELADVKPVHALTSGISSLFSGAPVSSTVLPVVAAAHGLANIPGMGRFGLGRTDASFSNRPQALIDGATAADPKKLTPELQQLRELIMSGQSPGESTHIPGARTGDTFAEGIARGNRPGPGSATAISSGHPVGGPAGQPHGIIDGPPTSTVSREAVQNWFRDGHLSRLPEGASQDILRLGGQRIPGSGNRIPGLGLHVPEMHLPTKTFRMPGRAAQLASLLAYPAIFGTEYATRQAFGEHQRERQLQQLLQSPETQALLRAPAQRSQ